MLNIIKGYAGTDGIFTDEVQDKLDELHTGKVFKVEEYFGSSLTVIIYKHNVHVVKILQCVNDTYICTVNQFEDDIELRNYLIRNRLYICIKNIDAVVLDVVKEMEKDV
jgi:hypothetical protein